MAQRTKAMVAKRQQVGTFSNPHNKNKTSSTSRQGFQAPGTFFSHFMPYVLPKVTVVAEGEEEAEDPEVFEPKWSKSEGEPPIEVKDFRKYIRHAGYHFDKAGVALGIHIPASHRSGGILRAQVKILDDFAQSRWRLADEAEFVERIIEHHNNALRFKRCNEKKKLERAAARQPEKKPATKVVKGKQPSQPLIAADDADLEDDDAVVDEGDAEGDEGEATDKEEDEEVVITKKRKVDTQTLTPAAKKVVTFSPHNITHTYQT